MNQTISIYAGFAKIIINSFESFPEYNKTIDIKRILPKLRQAEGVML